MEATRNRVIGASFHRILYAVSLLIASTTACATDESLGELESILALASAQDQAGSDDPTKDEATDDMPAAAQQPSDAEKITDLERTIEAQETRIRELEAELASPESEYARAEQEFRELDQEMESAREQLEQYKQEGKAREASLLERSIKAAEEPWRLAKDRFELAIEERKTLKEEIATLKLKLQKDRTELAQLRGTDSGSTVEDTAAAKESDKESNDAAETQTDQAQTDSPPTSETPGPTDEGEPDEELMEAEADAREKEKEAQEATKEAQELAGRISDLEKIISQEQRVLALARKRADLALATRQSLEEQLAKKQSEGSTAEELAEINRSIAEANQRYARARQEVSDSTDRLNDSRAELSGLQQQQIIALQAAEKTRLNAEAAKQVVEELRNPFAPRNLLKWLIERGPKVIMYFFAMIAMLQAAKMFSHRIVCLMAGTAGRGTSAERENRAQTLVGVFQNAASVTIIIGGTLIILDEMGAKVGVLLGGVAVVGLAVAFGAQNLIKDYFYGFVMLLENQYMLNDIVKIGSLSGQVERITLRMTVLRDADGVVHFIPNGQINCVSNETHGWSRATFEIGVAYSEDLNRCIAVLTELAMQLRRDPIFGPMIIEDPTIPAVDQLGESSVVLKFFIKTRPHQQRVVRRELLHRIKCRFDELQIEMPFPQRTIHHRYVDGDMPETRAQMRKSA